MEHLSIDETSALSASAPMHNRIFGHGERTLLAFHGFGRTGEDMHALEPALGALYTIHAFDLHFHGNSGSPSERVEVPFQPAELAKLVTTFLDEQGTEKADLLGYSLGGRFVLNLVEHIPTRIGTVFLLAPDGMVHRPWYRALVTSAVGRMLYRSFIDHPAPFHGLLHLLRKFRVISAKRHRFLVGETETRTKRARVRDLWSSYRLIEPSLDRVSERLRTHGIVVHQFYGEFDRIIPPRLGNVLKTKAPEMVHVHVLPIGHLLLTHSTAQRIADVLK